MRLVYFISALFIGACVACPAMDAMTEEERKNAHNPHSKVPKDFKFRFVTEEQEVEFHRQRKLHEEKEQSHQRRLFESGEKKTEAWQAITAPYCMNYDATYASTTSSNVCAAYNIVKPAFDNAIASLNGDVYWLSTVYGALVRLPFHDAGEVDITSSDIFGPDGCLSYDSGNAGLTDIFSLVYYSVEPLYQSVCNLITRADLWVMLGKLALESAEPTGALTIDFQYGRQDADYSTGCSITGRLPSSEGDTDELYRVFVTQMGMTLNDAATLLGAHSLGHMHTYYSGYGTANSITDGYTNGFDDTPHIFDNNYFYNMLINSWTSSTSPFFSNLIQFQMTGNNAMVLLPVDISVGYIRTASTTSGSSYIAQTCGPYAVPISTYANYKWTTTYNFGCTTSSATGSSTSTTVMPLTCWQSCNHGNSNSYFLSEFRKSWNKMTCAGYGVPACSTGATASGKLGTLTYLDLNTCSA